MPVARPIRSFTAVEFISGSTPNIDAERSFQNERNRRNSRDHSDEQKPAQTMLE